jgi:hypothetical protein
MFPADTHIIIHSLNGFTNLLHLLSILRTITTSILTSTPTPLSHKTTLPFSVMPLRRYNPTLRYTQSRFVGKGIVNA